MDILSPVLFVIRTIADIANYIIITCLILASNPLGFDALLIVILFIGRRDTRIINTLIPLTGTCYVTIILCGDLNARRYRLYKRIIVPLWYYKLEYDATVGKNTKNSTLNGNRSFSEKITFLFFSTTRNNDSKRA